MKPETKINTTFELETEVAEKDGAWLWLQIGVATIETDEGTYQIQLSPSGLKLKTPDGKVILTAPLNDLLSSMIDVAKETKRKV